MKWDEFSDWGRRVADWTQNYHQTVGDRPVRANTEPGEILNALPATPPEGGEGMEAIFADFEKIVMPGITHWQHPRFFAYFNSNASAPSVLAEFLASAIATAVHALADLTGGNRDGNPDDGLAAPGAGPARAVPGRDPGQRLLCHPGGGADHAGKGAELAGQPTRGCLVKRRLRIYCSAEVHTSVDRAIWVAGIGQQNLMRVPIKGDWRGMDPAALEAAIKADIAAGHQPAGVILCVGGTGTGATDPIGSDPGLWPKNTVSIPMWMQPGQALP